MQEVGKRVGSSCDCVTLTFLRRCLLKWGVCCGEEIRATRGTPTEHHWPEASATQSVKWDILGASGWGAFDGVRCR